MGSTFAVVEFGEGGRYGYAGVIYTSILTNDGFLWFVPGEKPPLSVLKEMRRVIEGADMRLWSTVAKRETEERFAKFVGMRWIAPDTETTDVWSIEG